METWERPEIAGVEPGNAAESGSSALGTAPSGPELREQFARLAGNHLDGLYRSALRLTRNPAAAQDLVQDVMLKAWRSFHTFQAGTSGRAWLHRILMNAFFDAYRKRMREPDTVDNGDSDGFSLYEQARAATVGNGGNPEAEVLDRVLDAEVRAALESLPPSFRAAIVLADVEGFTYKEISDALGIPLGTVMSRLSRGRHMLQRRLWDYARQRHFLKGDGQ